LFGRLNHSNVFSLAESIIPLIKYKAYSLGIKNFARDTEFAIAP